MCSSRWTSRSRRPRAGRAHRRLGRGGHVRADPFTPRAKKVLELALRGALSLGHNYIGTEHILLGLVRENEGARPDPARLRRGLREDPQRGHPHAVRLGERRSAGQAGAGAAPGPASRARARSPQAAGPVRAQPHQAGRRRQARPGHRPRGRDRADHADPLAPHEEQPGPDRGAGRRQDRRRGPGAAHHELRRPRAAEGQADLHAGPGGARRRSTAGSSRSASRR